MSAPAGAAATPQDAAAARVPGERTWPYHAALWAVALAFCLPYLLPGNVLIPSSLATMPPWSEDGAPATSNDLMRDGLVLTLPARTFNRERLRAGELPLWNPHVFAGYPHLAMIQNNALYPLSAPLDVALDPATSMDVSVWLHLALAGSLMLAFLRRTGLHREAALVGGVAFQLNGMFLIRLSAPSYVFSGTWLPLLLIGAHAIARRGTLRAGLPVALATFFGALGGHPQIAVLALAAASAYLLWEIVPRAATASQGAARVAIFLAHVALGLGLAAFQLVPFAELVANTARDTIPLATYLRSALPLPALLQALLPDIFGNPVDGSYWLGESAHLLDGHARTQRVWNFNYSGENVFTGVAPLLLAGLAVLRGTRAREIAFFAALALASLAVLLGTPLLDAAYHLVPGFSHSRPDRVLFLYMAAVAVLCGHGFAAATEPQATSRRPRLLPIAVTGSAALLLAWTALPLLWTPERRATLRLWLALAGERAAAGASGLLVEAAIAAFVVGLGLYLVAASRRGRLGPRAAAVAWSLLVALPSFAFGWKFNPPQPAPRLGATSIERALAAGAAPRSGEPGGPRGRLARVVVGPDPVLPANLAQLLDVDDAHGASAAGPERYLALVAHVDPGSVGWQKYFPAFRDPEVARGPVLDLLAADLVLADAPLPPPYQLIERAGDVRLYRNPDAPPRFRVLESVQVVPGAEEARRRVADATFDPSSTVVVPAAVPARTTEPSGDEAAVVVERFSPEHVVLDVTAPRGGVLVSSEAFYPGWRTTIDGRPTQTLVVNAAFRGAAIPSGRHRVELVFAPRSLALGGALSVLSALALLLLCRRRDHDPGAARRDRS